MTERLIYKKSYLLLLTLFLFGFTLIGCDKTPKEKDTIPPLLTVYETTIKIRIGEPLDLMQGVTGLDNVEGDITNRITIDQSNFNPNQPGTYTVIYYLVDKDGNSATPVTRTIIIIGDQQIEDYQLYTEEIAGEKLPQAQNCFPGAWYHKVVSSKDYWRGIVGVITLPTYTLDEARFQNGRYLDNPSIYMGGNAGSESDAGLSLSLAQLKNGSISTYSMVYRPFWRYITTINKDEGGYSEHNGEYAVSCTGNNCYGNWHYKNTEYYYLPGDTIKMMVYSPKENYLQLVIDVISVSTIPEVVNLRKTNGWNDPKSFISPMFYSGGHGRTPAEFKRVNAIDQVANEGKPAQATAAVVENAVWKEAYLLRNISGQMYRVPFVTSRQYRLSCPSTDAFVITVTDQQTLMGGETVSILPRRKEN